MKLKTIAAAVVAVVLFLPLRAEALETNELLALVAMPLAVAAVSEVTDVPMSDLVDVVTLLNDANVPPVQFVEVVRYAPVALVVEEPTRTPFVEFVRTRFDAGVVGVPLVTEIEREIRFYGVPDVELDVVAPSLLVTDNDVDFIPAPVRTRLAEHRSGHPHGGPPGQLKKELGLKTGAEVVHGSERGSKRVARRADDDGDRRVAKPRKVKRARADRVDRDRHVDRVDRPARRVAKAPKVREHRGGGGDKGKGHGNGNGSGKGHGKGKGKG